MYVLGISAYYHDSAAVLFEQGRVLAAAQEERFTRVKGDSNFPHHAVGYCLAQAGITVNDLDYVVYYENPLIKFERLLISYHLTAPRSLQSFLTAMPSWITEKLWQRYEIPKELGLENEKTRIIFCDHHYAHAASAFLASPFTKAAVLTIDGVGEWSTTTYGVGQGNSVQLLKQLKFPNSLGLLYSAFTYYCGFRINSGEYKLMGLAPFGEPKYVSLIKDQLVKICADGSIVLNQKYFNYINGVTMTNSDFHDLFGRGPRVPETELTQLDKDLAASVQKVTEEIILKMAAHVRNETGEKHLVLGGGVALNAVANGVLARSGLFEQVWIQPAAGDAGGALGAALWLWHMFLGKDRVPGDIMQQALLGPNIAPAGAEDTSILQRMAAVFTEHTETELAQAIAERLSKGKVVAVARGPMEYGPRALGNRSILADPRVLDMQKQLNLKVKFREGFRPFAPMVLANAAKEYFELKQDSPYMLFVAPVKEKYRKLLPAITHQDNTARVQTVADKTSFNYAVLQAFQDLTGCAVLINTSFNVRGEPIVCTAEDAFRCFMATDIDTVVIGNRLLDKEVQDQRPLNESERQAWLKRFVND